MLQSTLLEEEHCYVRGLDFEALFSRDYAARMSFVTKTKDNAEARTDAHILQETPGGESVLFTHWSHEIFRTHFVPGE